MTRSKKYYEVLGQLSEAQVLPESWEESCLFMETFFRIRRYALKHHRLAEMDCNGVGVIRSQVYYGGQIDDWARKEYGYSVKSAFIDDDTTVFSAESDKIESKIKSLCDKIGIIVEFQGDPRGATVKLYTQDKKYIPLSLI